MNEKLEYKPSQKKVINEVVSFLTAQALISTNKRKIFKIIGSAGTGKTTIIKAIIEQLLPLNKRISVVAPTYKALSVIQEKTDFTYQQKVKYSTLASLLKMGKVIDQETGESSFTFTSATYSYALSDTDLVFIDEASMVNKEQYEILLKISEEKKVNIIFIGEIV